MRDPAASRRGKPKLFVLDTNVILHDSNCIRNFQENDIAIPIVVLEELDTFKRGGRDINLQAREFLRQLDELTGDLISDRGASLGDGRGRVRVVLSGPFDERLRTAFLQDSPDHRILNTAIRLQREEPTRPVILVSKDTNLRMKAKSIGCTAQDYHADKVGNLDEIYAGKRTYEGLPKELISALHEEDLVSADRLEQIRQPIANENFVLKNGSASVLATFRADTDSFRRLHRTSAFGVKARNAEQAFAISALLDDQIKLVSLAGKAGTGKTLLALAAALECRKDYRQILVARPIVPLSNRDLGYLPGDIDAKIDPYMQPLIDNLAAISNEAGDREATAQQIARLRESEKLVCTPLAYIRGRSLHRVFFIVDEAQNLTPHEVKTIITRAGEGTKVVFTGDIRQIDQPYLDSLSNGLSYLISRMRGQPIYAHITLEKGERSALSALASSLL
ncbi:MAG: PhoH family protein [Planctomycetes bacterium]|nr:PhoH family protein [Planctomycetota bacterium]MCB9868856.1 PhoH family protein [Planctomycetota bacterium]MCB9889570.1 PhoH family protein [Planctomycetota bacterium]